MKDYPPGPVWGGGINAYQGCAHNGCHKKMRTTELGHDCCEGSRHSTEHYLDAQPDPYQPIGAQLGKLFRGWTDTRRRS